MAAVTPDNLPLSILDDLIDNERRARFFTGSEPPDATIAPRLLAALGPLPLPQVSLHVAGSEGKTSTTERLAAGLSALGLRTGAFTSPHLHDPLERLRIDGELPPARAVAEAAADVVAAARAARLTPSWFDAMTAVARLLFARQGVGAVVWETGLGGRLDSTRAVPADLCLITSISLEHSAVLGPTIEAIAGEKAGILREGVPLLLPAGLAAAAQEVFMGRARALGCPVERVQSSAQAGAQELSADMALAALRRLAADGHIAVPDEATSRAVRAWQVAGRGQRHGDVLFDGAHSLAATERLARDLKAQPPGPVIFAATSGRDALAMAAALQAVADPLIVTRVPGPRRGDAPAELVSALAERGGRGLSAPIAEDDPHGALALARKLFQPGRQIVVTGSLYLVGLLMPDRSSPC